MLKGKTVIELTDVNTGEVERHEDTNMITNALNDIFTNTIQCLPPNVWSNNFTPIVPNAIGGILLFQESLEEDPNKFYAPSSNPCIGYASNDVNSNSNTKRGSMNLNESKKLENGYKFVWDFNTSQGNGEIAAVALTHKTAGKYYRADGYGKSIITNNSIEEEPGLNSEKFINFKNIIEINFKENYAVNFAMFLNSNDIKITKIAVPYTKLNSLTSDFYNMSNQKKIEEVVITPSIFVPIVTDEGYINKIKKAAFFDGKDGFWYGFAYKNYNLLWIKISKTDYSFTEGSWSMNGNSLNMVGAIHCSDNYGNTICSALMNGFFYCFGSNKRYIFKIDIKNPTKITEIDLGFTASGASVFKTATFNSSNSSEAISLGVSFINFGDYLQAYDFILTGEDKVYRCGAFRLEETNSHLFQFGTRFLGYGESEKKFHENIYMRLDYLATINNLAETVQKTNDKTMKITYTITDET